MLFLGIWNLFWIFNINMNFLGIRRYPEFFYNFLQFFLNFSELIMIFFNFAIRRFPFWDSSHQSISLFGQLPSINFLFGMFPIKIFPFWYFSEIKFLKFFQKRKSAVNIPKRKLPFHLSNCCSTFWLPRRTPKKEISFFGNS